MFKNNYYNKKEIVVIPKNNLKHDNNKIDVKVNNNNKSYENIRNIVQKDDKEIDIKSIPNTDNTKKNYNNLKNNII
jgi:hypothetical protein